MNRLEKYKDSLKKFVADRTTIYQPSLPNKLTDIVNNDLKAYDFILPILFLTMVNNYNKKTNSYIQSYHSACSIMCVDLLKNVILNRSAYNERYGSNMVSQAILHYNNCAHHSMYQNIQSIKGNMQHVEVLDIYSKCFQLLNDILGPNKLHQISSIKSSGVKCVDDPICKDVLTWYLKNIGNAQKYIVLDKMTVDCYKDLYRKKNLAVITFLFEMWFCMSGEGTQHYASVENLSKSFSKIHTIYTDFRNITNKQYNPNYNGFTTNYVINHGLQHSYNIYITQKTKFVELCMNLDVYTNTLNEIVDYVEEEIDKFVEKTDPEMKSMNTNHTECDEETNPSTC